MDSMTVRDIFVGVRRFLGGAVAGFNHLLWPSVCDWCRAGVLETDRRLCRDCWNELLECTAGDYCPGCGKYAIISSFAKVGKTTGTPPFSATART